MHAPKDSHWPVVKRILWYLKHTMHHGLLIRKCGTPQLRVFSDTESPHIAAFSDADWAGCPDDRIQSPCFNKRPSLDQLPRQNIKPLP